MLEHGGQYWEYSQASKRFGEVPWHMNGWIRRFKHDGIGCTCSARGVKSTCSRTSKSPFGEHGQTDAPHSKPHGIHALPSSRLNTKHAIGPSSSRRSSTPRSGPTGAGYADTREFFNKIAVLIHTYCRGTDERGTMSGFGVESTRLRSSALRDDGSAVFCRNVREKETRSSLVHVSNDGRNSAHILMQLGNVLCDPAICPTPSFLLLFFLLLHRLNFPRARGPCPDSACRLSRKSHLRVFSLRAVCRPRIDLNAWILKKRVYCGRG